MATHCVTRRTLRTRRTVALPPPPARKGGVEAGELRKKQERENTQRNDRGLAIPGVGD